MMYFTKSRTFGATLAFVAAGALPVVTYGQGFEISLNGDPVVSDVQVAEVVRNVDVRLADADVQITYDAIDPEPLLNIEMSSRPVGGRVRLVSETNYPAFIERGEVRLINMGAVGGPKLVSTTPMASNGDVQIEVPDGDYAVIYRVYGSRGRYDETHPLSLSAPDQRGLLPNVEEGADFAAVRNIRVRGRAVTVNAENIAMGGTLSAFGEVVPADPRGRAVIQRILPSGEHAIEVEVRDSRGPLTFGRDVDLDMSEWLYFVVADVEVFRQRDRETGDITTGNTARFQVFVDGETQSGIEVTGSLDTGAGPIEDAFSRLVDKDPYAVATRVGAEGGHLTFGDDSSMTDLTQTSGRVFLHVQRDENFFRWGDYQADVEGSGFLRNQRVLYGAQAHIETPAVTENGDARVAFDLTASRRDQLFGREVFRGTDGTVFFLSRQDLTSGTVVVQIERRDPVTGRVVDRVTLDQGEDYLINEFQGVLRLDFPVSDTVANGLGGEHEQYVVVQYEYTPVGFSGDGFDYSGRVETWVTDDIRIGLTGITQDNGTSTQEAYGVDLRYEIGENSFVQLDYARTSGAGFDYAFSSDAGLTATTVAAVAGAGEAYKLEFEIDSADFNHDRNNVFGGYAEFREQGFSTLDYSVTSSTGDQTLIGVFTSGETASGLSYHLTADHLDNELRDDSTVVRAEVGFDVGERTFVELGTVYTDETLGSRTDLAARLTYSLDKEQSIYAFARGAIAINGLNRNDRYGVGAQLNLGRDWMLGAEVSGGTIGYGVKIAALREDEDGNSSYFGWETDPLRAYEQNLTTNTNGRLVFGGRRQVNNDVSIYGENTYDVLGQTRDLTAAYGVDYQASDYLSFGVGISMGQVTETGMVDIDRSAYVAYVAYDDDRLTGRARLEYRLDHELSGVTASDVNSVIVVGDLRWKISDEQRVLLGLTAAQTETDTASLLGGTYVDASVGYAYRPIDNERINILASYRFLNDTYGQELDGVAGDGPVQRSHVLNIEGNYDINTQWTVGAKLGYRLTESAETATDPYAENDAALAILNARYHVTNNWDALIEVRHFAAGDSDFSETGGLVAVYRQFGDNIQAGVGYNFTSFSDELTDLTQDDEGVFLNIIAKF